jgi:Rer1 family
MEIAIPGMAGQIDAVRSIQMDGNRGAPHDFLFENIRRARMVHRYTLSRLYKFRSGKLMLSEVAYSLGIYLLNLFLAFLQPKFDPSNEAMDNEMEDGSAGGLPTKQDEEFRPFIRRLPEFKFWYSATRAITIGFVCTWFSIFDVPVFWPVLVVYWLILFALTSMLPCQEWMFKNMLMRNSEETDPAYDQVPICSVLDWKDEVQQEQLLVEWGFCF